MKRQGIPETLVPAVEGLGAVRKAVPCARPWPRPHVAWRLAVRRSVGTCASEAPVHNESRSAHLPGICP